MFFLKHFIVFFDNLLYLPNLREQIFPADLANLADFLLFFSSFLSFRRKEKSSQESPQRLDSR
ncbi:hypothetical protein FF52_17093 [Flavobacterium sp. F52]|nr:hypothetical protein FF52_17093 [Flavobacterium sp. F52]